MKWIRKSIIILYIITLIFMFLFPPLIARHKGISLIKYEFINTVMFKPIEGSVDASKYMFSVYTDFLIIQIIIITLIFTALYIFFLKDQKG